MDQIRVSSFGELRGHQAALQEGLYEANGLGVALDLTVASKVQMKGLLDGDLDIAHTNADNVFWWNEDNGADFVIVLASPGQPKMNFVVRPEVQTYQDLAGTVLAVDAAESGFATPLRVLLSQAGLLVDRDVRLMEFGVSTGRVDAMRKREASGAMLRAQYDPSADGFHVLDTIDRLFEHYPITVAVRQEWAGTHGDVLVRYLNAHLRSVAKAAEDVQGVPLFEWEGLREMLVMRQAAGLLRGPAEPGRFADDTFYKRVVDLWD